MASQISHPRLIPALVTFDYCASHTLYRDSITSVDIDRVRRIKEISKEVKYLLSVFNAAFLIASHLARRVCLEIFVHHSTLQFPNPGQQVVSYPHRFGKFSFGGFLKN